MSLDTLTTTQGDLIEARRQLQESKIRENSDFRPRMQLRITLGSTELTTAATASSPYIIDNPCNGFYVETATDSDVAVKLVLTSPEAQNTGNYTTIKKGDAGKFDAVARRVLLLWDAQPGKSITIVFYFGFAFQPGQLTNVISGGVTITDGTGMTPAACVSVTTSATALLAASSTRKKATLQNLGGTDLYISGVNTVVATSVAGDTTGLKIPPGGTYEWINSGACYGIVPAGTTIVGINTES